MTTEFNRGYAVGLATQESVFQLREERDRLKTQNAGLLEALKYCQVRIFMAEGCSEAYEMARAAIAAAPGGTP